MNAQVQPLPVRPATLAIPSAIHQTWKTAEVPARFAAFARSWRTHHPRWSWRMWSDADLRAFLAVAKTKADEANVPAEPVDFDPSEEVKRIVDKAMGPMLAEEPEEAEQPVDEDLPDSEAPETEQPPDVEVPQAEALPSE